MPIRFRTQWVKVFIMCSLLSGCGITSFYSSEPPKRIPAAQAPAPVDIPKPGDQNKITDTGWTRRVVTEDELYGVCERDPDLTASRCKEILARMNAKAPYYISEDIRAGRALNAPNDFRAYKNWTPLPSDLPHASTHPKFIVIAKDVLFLGWYERGRLQDSTEICIGKPGEETIAGLHRVLDKDADHYSRSYNNSYGKPAWMPWALRIYETVWIHAGDLTGPYCSHGCVILPLEPAEELFRWTDPGTPVMVVETLDELKRARPANTREASIAGEVSRGRGK